MKKLSLLILATILISACSITPQPTTTDSVEVVERSLYRGLDKKRNGKANLAPSQFKFNQELSTFRAPDEAPVQKPCLYVFTIILDSVNSISGSVKGLAGYTADFDNDPEGHWGISQPADVSAEEAKMVVSAYANAHHENIENNTSDTCLY